MIIQCITSCGFSKNHHAGNFSGELEVMEENWKNKSEAIYDESKIKKISVAIRIQQ